MIIYQIYKPHAVPVSYPTRHHSEQMCERFCLEMFSVEYGIGTLWDLSILPTVSYSGWLMQIENYIINANASLIISVYIMLNGVNDKIGQKLAQSS